MVNDASTRCMCLLDKCKMALSCPDMKKIGIHPGHVHICCILSCTPEI